MANSFGKNFRFLTFGESHGAGVGVVIDGCPAGVTFDADSLALALERRRPGSRHTSKRKEPDQPEVLSGVFEGRTLGSPIAILVRNRDARSEDYADLKDLYRPSHADFTYSQKYGRRDYRGGGRASARETLGRVAAGSVAKMFLQGQSDLSVCSAVSQLGEIHADNDLRNRSEENVYDSEVRCTDPEAESRMISLIEQLREEGDSIGGIVETLVNEIPAGLGEPIYDKLEATLASAMLSINGAMGFDFGAGFGVAERRGSRNNDEWVEGPDGGMRTRTNNSGGIQGGISNGMPVQFRVPFKPPSSIGKPQEHGSAAEGTIEHAISGRHDPSIVVRAVPVVEAMTWIVLADLWLAERISRAVHYD